MGSLHTPQFIYYKCRLGGGIEAIGFSFYGYIRYSTIYFLWMSFAGLSKLQDFPSVVTLHTPQFIYLIVVWGVVEAIGFSFYGYITYSTIYLLDCRLGGCRSYRIFLLWLHYIPHNLFIVNVVWGFFEGIRFSFYG